MTTIVGMDMNIEDKMNGKIVYTLDKNHCRCHPETCSCMDYMIFKNKEEYTSVRNKEIGNHIVEALNFFEENKNLEGKTEYRKYGCRDQIEIDSRVGGMD